jgi:hypothetical protein
MQDHNGTPEALPCFAHCHMRAAEYGFYELCRALAHKTGTVYFDGRKIAARFGRMSKTTAYDLAHALTEKGFFEVVRQPGYRKNGTFQPYYFRVLSHKEWAAEHPGKCSPVQIEVQVEDEEPVRKEGQVSSPVRNLAQPVRKENQPVRNLAQPVQRAGHNPIKSNPLKSNPICEADMAPPVPHSGQGVSTDFMTRHGKKSRTGQGKSGSAPAVPARPVQKEGQVVLGTDEAELTQRAERLLEPFTSELGIMLGLHRAPWIAGVKLLLDRGSNEDLIRQALEQAVRGAGSHREGVRRHQSFGFVEWLKQMQREIAETANTEVAA